MSRRIRHIHARSDEWVRVHRHRPGSDGSGWGCLVLIIILWLLFH